VRRAVAALAVGLLCPVAAAGQTETSGAAEEAAREAAMFGAPDAADDPAPSESVGDPAPSEEAAREADMFGGPEEPDAPSADGVEPTADSDRDAALFDGTPRAIEASDFSDGLSDRTDIGGRLYLRLQAEWREDTDAGDQTITMPNLLDVYLDARPNDRVRAYFRGRIAQDPSGGGRFAELAGVDPREPDFDVDQMWIRFDVARTAFVTVGRQQVRWGKARVWNPTDFVNATRRDPLTTLDLRSGVTMARVQVPVGDAGSNLQAMALLEDADALGEIGGVGRFELALTSAEIGISGAARDDGGVRGGLDFSAGLTTVGIDVYGEAAYDQKRRTIRGVEDAWTLQAVGGLEYEFVYTDQDTAIVGAEYFFNQAGITDRDQTDLLLLQGVSPPYIGKHAIAAYTVWAQPGDWNTGTLFLTGIYNVSDRTGTTRLNVSQQVLTDLWLDPYVAGSFGPAGGAWRFDLTEEEAALASLGGVEIPPIPPLVVDAGLWMRVEM
jgi:hypothetical protein